MRAVSDAFLRTLKGSHTPFIRARICEPFQTGTSPTGVEVEVVDGEVVLDGTADVRGTLDITVKANWPLYADDLLAPYGNEVYVERGIKYSDDSVELVGFGYFRIDTVEAGDIRRYTPIRITGPDRMQAIIEARLQTPRQFLNGTTFGVVVENLVTEVYPDATITWDDNSDLATLTRSVIVEEDRFGFLDDAITSRGKIWYWDHTGNLVIRDVPTRTTYDYEVNQAAYGVLVSMGRSLTRTETYNVVVATGEGADTQTPVRGVAYDDDPESPTYYLGPFGQVTRFYSSPFLETDEQCESAAASVLARELGLIHQVNFGTIVNPALEPYDVVKIDFSHQEAPQLHVLDVIPIPLSPAGSMNIDTRQSRITLGG